MKKLVKTILSLIIAWNCQAQTEQQILPTELKKQTIITQPATLYKGFFRVGMSANYLFLNKIFNEDGDRESISNAFGKTWIAQAIFQYGVNDRLQVELSLPYINQTLFLSFLAQFPFDNSSQQIKFEQNGRGISDITMSGTYQLITENDSRPALTGRVTIFLPTGEKNPTNVQSPNEFDAPTGRGHLASEVTFNVRKTRYPFLFSGFVGYKFNFEGNKVIDVGEPSQDFRDGGFFNISGLVGYHVNEWMAIINDLNYNRVGKNQVNGFNIDSEAKWSVEYIPRLSFQIKQLRINQALTFPLWGKLSGADPGYIMVVQYVF